MGLDVYPDRALTRLGLEADAASMAGGALAKVRSARARVGMPGSRDADVDRRAVAVTVGASNVYGAWTEILPAAAIATDFVLAGLHWDSIQIVTVQLGVGAAAAEVDYYQFRGSSTDASGFLPVMVPPVLIRIPANSRCAVRAQHNTASTPALTFSAFFLTL